MQAYHPGFAATVNYSRVPLSDDPDAAVAQTIGLMAQLVRADRTTAAFHALAQRLAGGSVVELKRNVFTWCKSRVRFVQDHVIADSLRLPRHASGFLNDVAEVLIRPIDLVRMPDAQGDCDDFSMLAACILSSAGVPAFFVTLAADQRAPDQFSHVYVLAGADAFDASHGPYMGWEAKNRFGKRQVWSVETGMPIIGHTGTGFPIMAGLGQDGGLDAGGFPIDTGGGLDAGGFPIDTGGAPINTGGGGSVPAVGQGSGTPWWAGDINSALSAALSIFKARYAVPPPGTVITTKGGTIATGVQPGSVLATQSSIFGQIPIWVWMIGALAILLLVSKGRK
jgi:hypothetical protein